MIYMLDFFILTILTFVIFNFACFVTLVRNAFSSYLILFLATSAWPFSCDSFISSPHLFLQIVHLFIPCVALSSLIACISALNSCFYKMMTSLSLFELMCLVFIFPIPTFFSAQCPSVFFCSYHLFIYLFI